MAGCNVKLKGNSVNLIVEIAVRVVLFIIFLILEDAKPFIRVIHDEEMWLYKNPRSEDTIPTHAMFSIAIILPTIVICVLTTLRKDKVDAREALLGLSLSLALNGVITNTTKIMVGRPRPDYFWRCYPNGVPTKDLQCDGDPDVILEGRKSFPSGHSSWAFSGLAYLSLYLCGKLHCFHGHGRGQGWRLCVSLTPFLSALAIALTRYSDYKHHWQDITIGSFLGIGIAVICYRQYYPAINKPHCDLPYSAFAPLKHIDEQDGHPVLPLLASDANKSNFHPAITKHL
ncbi:phospholipid phosphatase 5-like [Actinia tenebrosa]|uniref:Phospholipid phosphatase 5-like n=1 Tax=Actinia tenebrosa TaxID=6105 RepID=A0A6P8IJV5_ACTTE|nr:phospholipid phosphatase 5-like [Actinia tenebrosa]